MSMNSPVGTRLLTPKQAARELGVPVSALSSLPLRVFDLGPSGRKYLMSNVLEYRATMRIPSPPAPIP